MQGPPVGDSGYVGYPSLDDQESFEGELASFEYIYKGYAAIGYRPRVLEAIRAFLVAHRRHSVGLFLDGEEYGGRFPPLKRTPSKTFKLTTDDDDIVNGPFELACQRCGAVYRTVAQDLRSLKPRMLTKQRIEEFSERVLDVASGNFYRCWDMLDNSSAHMRQLDEFLGDHGRHKLTVRIVAEEEWSARLARSTPRRPLPSALMTAGPVTHDLRQWFWNAANVMPHPAAVAPPLRLKWAFQHGRGFRDPLVADGFVYTPVTSPDALVCISPDGDEVWRLNVEPPHALPDDRGLAVLGDQLLLTLDSPQKEQRELLIIDRRTGEVERRSPFPSIDFAVLPGGDRIVACRREHDDPRERTIGLFDLSNIEKPVWHHRHTARLGNPLNYGLPFDSGDDASFQRFAIDDGHVYTEWGDFLVALRLSDGEATWRQSVAEFDGRAFRYASPLTVANETLLLNTMSGLVAFSSANGEERWRQPIAGWPRVVCDGVIYAVECNPSTDEIRGGIFTFDVRTGRSLQKMAVASKAFARTPLPRPRFMSSPALGLMHVFVSDADGRLWAFDRATLKPEWMLLPQQPVSVAVPYGNRLLARGGVGQMLCFEGPSNA
jgi:outer membrane protein assembly factor BamB